MFGEILHAYASQPGCPASVRLLALIEASPEIHKIESDTYGKEQAHRLLTSLYDRIQEEGDDGLLARYQMGLDCPHMKQLKRALPVVALVLVMRHSRRNK